MPATPPPAPRTFHQEFTDFDAFEAAAKGWNLDYLQLDPGGFRASLTQLMTENVVISRCSLGRRFLQRGETPPGFRTFGLAAGEDFALKWRGHEVGPRDLMIFPSGHSLESVSPPGFDAFAISIEEEWLEQLAKKRGFDGKEPVLPDADLLSIPAAQSSKLRQLLLDILDQSIRHPKQIETPGFLKRVDHDFVEALLDTIASGSEVESLIFTDCRFYGNEAMAGGAMWINSDLRLEGCELRLNSAEIIGGAIAKMKGTTVISRCDFRQNSAGNSRRSNRRRKSRDRGDPVCILGQSMH